MEKTRKTAALHVDNELHADFKVYCAQLREKMQEVTTRLIEKEIESKSIQMEKQVLTIDEGAEQ